MRYLLVLMFLTGCSGAPQAERTGQLEQDAGSAIGSTAVGIQTQDVVMERCIADCVQSRQMEAISHRVIEQQCADGCRSKAGPAQLPIKNGTKEESPDKHLDR